MTGAAPNIINRIGGHVRHGTCIALAALVASLCLVAGPATSLAGTPRQATGEDLAVVKKWCQTWERRWDRAFDRWVRAANALHPEQDAWWSPDYDVPMPQCTDPAVWKRCGRFMRKLAYEYNERFAKLRYRMKHPAKPYRYGSWRPLIRYVWDDHDEWTIKMVDRIMGRESNWQPGCITGSFRGLMQCYNGPLDPEQNIRTAHRWWHDARRQGGTGWEPWACTAW